ncbi:MAG: hypothetical protein GXO92_07765 [FCB group bacterium]|nr:hypothetical protein [FCB group bacterium]
MRARLVLTVIHQEVEVIKNSNIIWGFLFLFICAARGDTEPVTIRGRITYVTVDQIYTDLGSNAGVEIGDTLHVLRRQEEIGLIVVTNIARKSSVCSPLVPTDVFQLGDLVILEKILPSSASTEDVPETEQEKPATEIKIKPPRQITQSGNLTYRSTLSKFSSNRSDIRHIGTLQYGLTITRPIQIRVRIYGRTILPQNRFTFYQARVSVGERSNRLYLLAGRVFTAEMAGLGATDGFLLRTRMTSNTSIGILGGFQPEPGSLAFDTNIKKVGGYLHYQQKGKILQWEGSIAGVGQYAANKVDREFIYLRLLGRIGKRLRLALNQTIDLDRKDILSSRGLFESTSNQISLRYNPYKTIVLSTRYSSRRQVIHQVTQRVLPDSLFRDELRAGWYNSILFSHRRIGTFQLGLNIRGRESSLTESLMAVFQYHSSPTAKRYSYTFQTSYLDNLILRGIRGLVGVNRDFKMGSVYSEYEYYSYGFGKQIGKYTQHTITTGLFWRVYSKLQVSVNGEYSLDADANLFYLFLGATYRL